MSGVFQNIDSPPPPHRPAIVYRLWCGGRTHSLVREGDGRSIFWKTPDTALYSTYVSTLWWKLDLPDSVSTEVKALEPGPGGRQRRHLQLTEVIALQPQARQPVGWGGGGRGREATPRAVRHLRRNWMRFFLKQCTFSLNFLNLLFFAVSSFVSPSFSQLIQEVCTVQGVWSFCLALLFSLRFKQIICFGTTKSNVKMTLKTKFSAPLLSWLCKEI